MSNTVVEIEKSLLGAILVHEKLFYSIKGRMNAKDFFDKKNQIIFAAVEEIYDKGIEDIELPPIIEQLKKTNNLTKIGGENYLGMLMNNAGLQSNATKYMMEIIQKAELRNVKILLQSVSKEVDSATSAENILEILEQKVINSARGIQIKEFVNSKDGVENAVKALEARALGENISGISTGYAHLDKITGGFQNGDLIILAARPSMGKTALALNLATNIARKKNVAFFSLEMPIIQLWNRILSSKAYIHGNKIKSGQNLTAEENEKIYFAKEKLAKLNLFIDDTAGIKLPELVWKAKRLAKNKGIDAIFIDYLQLIVLANEWRGENRQNEVSIISRNLKKLARDLNVPVIALSQLSRRVEQRESKVPMMSDIRESGAIEQDADLISFVYRDSYYNKEEQEDIAKVIIAKHRNGGLGEVNFFFNAAQGSFIEKSEQ